MFSNGFNMDPHSLLGPFYPLALPHSPFQPLCPPCSFSCDSRSTRTHPETPQGRGKWTALEQGLYITFLLDNMDQMRCRLQRKSLKVFLQMARKVKSRSADQCRSHHQKILKYHGDSLEEIISHYQDLPSVVRHKAENAKIDGPAFVSTGVEEEHADAGVVARCENRFRMEINTEVIARF